MAEAAVVRSHRWELAGLGIAPFVYMGMHEEVFRMPDGSSKAGGSCDYCGQGIRYVFRVQSSDGRKFKVGCDCIAHCHDPAEKIVVQAKRALKAFKRDAAAIIRAAKRKADAEARKAAGEAKAVENRAKLASDPLYQRIKAAVGVSNYGDGIDGQGGNEFLRKMRDAMERWGALSEKQEAAALRVLERIEEGPARKAASQYLGALGERVKIVAKVEMSRCIYHGFDRYDPDRWLNKLRSVDGSAIVWFGSYGLQEGAEIAGSASIKKLEEYQGEKQSVISNPRWKEAS